MPPKLLFGTCHTSCLHSPPHGARQGKLARSAAPRDAMDGTTRRNSQWQTEKVNGAEGLDPQPRAIPSIKESCCAPAQSQRSQRPGVGGQAALSEPTDKGELKSSSGAPPGTHGDRGTWRALPLPEPLQTEIVHSTGFPFQTIYHNFLFSRWKTNTTALVQTTLEFIQPNILRHRELGSFRPAHSRGCCSGSTEWVQLSKC